MRERNFLILIMISAFIGVVALSVGIHKTADTKEEMVSKALGDMKSILVLEQDFLKKERKYFSLKNKREMKRIEDVLRGKVYIHPENEIVVKTYTCKNTLFGYVAKVKNNSVTVFYDSCVNTAPQIIGST